MKKTMKATKAEAPKPKAMKKAMKKRIYWREYAAKTTALGREVFFLKRLRTATQVGWYIMLPC